MLPVLPVRSGRAKFYAASCEWVAVPPFAMQTNAVSRRRGNPASECLVNNKSHRETGTLHLRGVRRNGWSCSPRGQDTLTLTASDCRVCESGHIFMKLSVDKKIRESWTYGESQICCSHCSVWAGRRRSSYSPCLPIMPACTLILAPHKSAPRRSLGGLIFASSNWAEGGPTDPKWIDATCCLSLSV